MAAQRWWLPLVGGALIAAALAHLAYRRATRPDTPVVPATSAGSGRAALAAPEAPALAGSAAEAPAVVPAFGPGSAPATDAGPAPALAAPPPAAPGAQPTAFAAQARDPAWAGATERDIQRRLAKHPTLQRAECRQDTCELTLGGGADAVADTLAAIEQRGGLRDVATSVYLTAPEQKDGAMTLRAYVQFAR